MPATPNSLIQSLSQVPTSVQNSLDSLRDLSRDITLLGLDVSIFLGYFIYVVLFFVAIRGVVIAIKKYKEDEHNLKKLFFVGFFEEKK